MSDVIQSIFQLTAFDPAAGVSPYPRLNALRDTCPIFRDEGNKTWFASEYGTVRSVLSDTSLLRAPEHAEPGSVASRGDGATGKGRSLNIIHLDDPDHSRIRFPLSQAFYARINKQRLDIEKIIDDVVDQAPNEGGFDLVEAIASPAPVRVIAKVLGVDSDRLEEFRQWSEAMILSLNPIRTAEQSRRMEWGLKSLHVYFEQLIEKRRARPQEDLVSDLVELQRQGAVVSDKELKVNLTALLAAGNLTTTDLIGNAVWLLLSHPEQLTAFRADPALASQAIEETLRFESPVGVSVRTLPEDRKIGGCPMRKGQVVMFSLQAANRDPAVYDLPDVFDITRKRAPHIAFGGGSHICIGAPLARMEAKRALVRIFDRYRNLELENVPLTWRRLPFFRGLERLQVRAS